VHFVDSAVYFVVRKFSSNCWEQS